MSNDNCKTKQSPSNEGGGRYTYKPLKFQRHKHQQTVPNGNEEDSDSDRETTTHKNGVESINLTQTSIYSMTNPLRYEIPVDSPLIGKFIQLKNIDNEDIVTYQIQSITSPSKEEAEEERYNLPDLIQESTNSWLYIETLNCNDNNQCTKLFIAIIVIILQIVSYQTLTYYFVDSNQDEIKDRASNCYGPNCETPPNRCMYISTGSVTAILLLGFLWADIINTFALLKNSINCREEKNKIQFIASSVVLVELIMALICGIYVGVYSTSEWDSINGAVGILFVHDLDEAIFSAMQVIQSNWKKILALFLWIILSIVIAISCTCKYPNDWVFFQDGDCKKGEFKCGDGQCIWYGFVCNGVHECVDGSDETVNCDFSLIHCPDDMFRCDTDGSCIDIDKRCDGLLDCENGEDESREQNCSALLAQKKCNDIEPALVYKYPNNYFYWKAVDNGAMFKCDNGQCIEFKYMCDGILDCIDGTDEYPFFYSPETWPYLKECLYSNFIECPADEILCKKNGKCISKSRVCDGVDDCPDAEDERLCDADFCGIDDLDWMTQFRCGGNIAAFNSTFIITFDGTVYDYTQPNATMSAIYPNISKIESSKCIPWEWRCDGMHDCEDGSDEQLCELDIFECRDNEFKCTDGECIPALWKCDYYEDCRSGNDELDCDLVYNSEANAEYITCDDEPKINTIQLGSDYSFYYKFNITCNEYKALEFSTCNEHTPILNTKLNVWRDYGLSVDTFWENTDSYKNGKPCPQNPYSSTIRINEDEFVCNTTYTILIQPEILKQTFVDFGINVVCSETNFEFGQ